MTWYDRGFSSPGASTSIVVFLPSFVSFFDFSSPVTVPDRGSWPRLSVAVPSTSSAAARARTRSVRDIACCSWVSVEQFGERVRPLFDHLDGAAAGGVHRLRGVDAERLADGRHEVAGRHRAVGHRGPAGVGPAGDAAALHPAAGEDGRPRPG